MSPVTLVLAVPVPSSPSRPSRPATVLVPPRVVPDQRVVTKGRNYSSSSGTTRTSDQVCRTLQTKNVCL